MGRLRETVRGLLVMVWRGHWCAAVTQSLGNPLPGCIGDVEMSRGNETMVVDPQGGHVARTRLVGGALLRRAPRQTR